MSQRTERSGDSVVLNPIRRTQSDQDVAEYPNEECRRQYRQVDGQFVRQPMTDDPQAKDSGARFKIRTFSSGYAPEFEGMTPKEILNVLDDEYYAKKLAGGTDEYNAMKAAEESDQS